LISIDKLQNQKISIFNRQRKQTVRIETIHGFLQDVTKKLGIKEGFTIVLVSDPAMQQYNLLFAGKNRVTDVLYFPVESDYRSAENYLGDILISVERAKYQTEFDTLEKEIQVLSLHGLLHLIGYDHETDSGEMEGVERRIRKEFGLEP
jgi:probable rRNA maturation factor